MTTELSDRDYLRALADTYPEHAFDTIRDRLRKIADNIEHLAAENKRLILKEGHTVANALTDRINPRL